MTLLLLDDVTLLKTKGLINGQWSDAENGKTIAINNPATHDTIASVPWMTKVETERAILAANNALPSWRAKTAKERSVILRAWYELIMQHSDDLAHILTSEQGKPLTEASTEIRYGAAFVEWFSEEAKRVYGDVIPSPIPNSQIIVMKQPIGVVGAITPWNFPCAMITRKCAPALAAGCTVVLKPSSFTPLTALALAELGMRAGLPDGVLNIVTGEAKTIGEVLTQNPLIRKISFTGSTAVGKKLMQQAANTVKKVSLELGGNASFIVFDDADMDAAVSGVIASKFRNAGQTCVCANRIFVQENSYNAFADNLTKAVMALKTGEGTKEDVNIGPLINTAAVEKVESHIADAIAKGARIMTGGKRHASGGTFFEPTVLRDVTLSAKIAQEETFGPVAPLFSFKAEEEAIALSNATPFGLAAYFYSQDVHRVFRVANQLESGVIGINSGIASTEVTPFGGIKESGIGREGSKYGIEEYIELKSLFIG